MTTKISYPYTVTAKHKNGNATSELIRHENDHLACFFAAEYTPRRGECRTFEDVSTVIKMAYPDVVDVHIGTAN